MAQINLSMIVLEFYEILLQLREYKLTIVQRLQQFSKEINSITKKFYNNKSPFKMLH